ncbi:MAG TPA: thioredoxin domain-containing protein [Polyangiaceae bacterium]|nr:thioredoxin domain-containing protein [Polyangiaceae bacterium]
MAPRLTTLVFRLAMLIALGTSSALLIDYMRPLPAFCDVGSGCDRVRSSGYGSLLGIPLPLVGQVGFAGLLVLSLFKGETARKATRLLAIVAGVTGMLLLLTQALVIGVFCKLCVAVDVSAVVAAFAGASGNLETDEAPGKGVRWLWPVAALASVVLPGAWALVQPSPPVPREIASLWVPGKINVVEFADFQCPYCRQLHPLMVPLLDEYADRVHFVRLNMPLASHEHAHGAALAYCCADEQGKAAPMADALFQAPDLSPAGCERAAAAIGLSMPAYRECVANPKTEARVAAEMQRVKDAGLAGLPTVWINEKLLFGLRPVGELGAAFAEAANGKPFTRLPTSVLWLAFGLGLVAVSAVALRTGKDRAPG